MRNGNIVDTDDSVNMLATFIFLSRMFSFSRRTENQWNRRSTDNTNYDNTFHNKTNCLHTSQKAGGLHINEKSLDS